MENQGRGLSKLMCLEAVVVIKDICYTREAFLLSKLGLEVKNCDIFMNDRDIEHLMQSTQNEKGQVQDNFDVILNANGCLNGASVFTEDRVEEKSEDILPLHVKKFHVIELDAFHIGFIRRTCTLSRTFARGFVRYVNSVYPEADCCRKLMISVQGAKLVLTDEINSRISAKTMIVVKLLPVMDLWLDYNW